MYPPTSTSPLGSTGEAVLATVHPDGSESFTTMTWAELQLQLLTARAAR